MICPHPAYIIKYKKTKGSPEQTEIKITPDESQFGIVVGPAATGKTVYTKSSQVLFESQVLGLFQFIISCYVACSEIGCYDNMLFRNKVGIQGKVAPRFSDRVTKII